MPVGAAGYLYRLQPAKPLQRPRPPGSPYRTSGASLPPSENLSLKGCLHAGRGNPDPTGGVRVLLGRDRDPGTHVARTRSEKWLDGLEGRCVVADAKRRVRSGKLAP